MLITFTPQSLAQSIADGTAIAVELTSAHCAPCKAVAQLLEQESEVCLSGWLTGSLSVDQWPQWAEEQGVRSVPVLRFYRGGRLLLEDPGLITRERLHLLLAQAQDGLESAAGRLRVLASEGRWDEAAVVLLGLSDEQSRHPHIQRIRSLLSMHKVPVTAALTTQRDDYLTALLTRNDAQAVVLMEQLLLNADDPDVRALAVALLDVFPDRTQAQRWRRMLLLSAK